MNYRSRVKCMTTYSQQFFKKVKLTTSLRVCQNIIIICIRNIFDNRYKRKFKLKLLSVQNIQISVDKRTTYLKITIYVLNGESSIIIHLKSINKNLKTHLRLSTT